MPCAALVQILTAPDVDPDDVCLGQGLVLGCGLALVVVGRLVFLIIGA